jgi:hypothetical protein
VQSATDEMQCDTVVVGVPGGHAVGDMPVTGVSPVGLSIVVRAGAAPDEAEAIAQGVQSPEGIGEAILEPAEHSGADAGEHGAPLPGVAQQCVETVQAPHGKQVRSVAAADIEDVVVLLARHASTTGSLSFHGSHIGSERCGLSSGVRPGTASTAWEARSGRHAVDTASILTPRTLRRVFPR